MIGLSPLHSCIRQHDDPDDDQVPPLRLFVTALNLHSSYDLATNMQVGHRVQYNDHHDHHNHIIMIITIISSWSSQSYHHDHHNQIIMIITIISSWSSQSYHHDHHNHIIMIITTTRQIPCYTVMHACIHPLIYQRIHLSISSIPTTQPCKHSFYDWLQNLPI